MQQQLRQWRQLKRVKVCIRRQIKRSELEANEPLPENINLDTLKLTPLPELLQNALVLYRKSEAFR